MEKREGMSETPNIGPSVEKVVDAWRDQYQRAVANAALRRKENAPRLAPGKVADLARQLRELADAAGDFDDDLFDCLRDAAVSVTEAAGIALVKKIGIE